MAQEYFGNLPKRADQTPVKGKGRPVQDKKLEGLMKNITVDTEPEVTREDIIRIKEEELTQRAREAILRQNELLTEEQREQRLKINSDTVKEIEKLKRLKESGEVSKHAKA